MQCEDGISCIYLRKVLFVSEFTEPLTVCLPKWKTILPKSTESDTDKSVSVASFKAEGLAAISQCKG